MHIGAAALRRPKLNRPPLNRTAAARISLILLALAALSGCVRLIPQTRAPVSRPAPARPSAALVGVNRGPAVSGLGFQPGNAREALAAFVTSCPRLTRRNDNSGLTRPTDWQAPCDAAGSWPGANASAFFTTYFETAEVGSGDAFVTGYFEHEIAGVRTRQPGFDVPIYSAPPDMVRARPGDAAPLADGRQPVGRYDQSGKFVPYYDRGQIEDGALAGRGLEIGWAADRADVFFLQIQGSGRLRAPDGSVMRLGFAAQNGFAYTGIGTLMRARGIIGSGAGQYPGTMQGIVRYLREHPEEGRALMRENRSYVFMRETVGVAESIGPVGALGVPVRARGSVAADPAFVPLGAPVWLQLDNNQASGLWVAQDTGGAISGANRFDSFWGAGEAAQTIAGGMSARGRALVLLPKGTIARLNQR
jgi:membrane-bound lytic murein transglycosylase A